jgi:hypothetical protein
VLLPSACFTALAQLFLGLRHRLVLAPQGPLRY